MVRSRVKGELLDARQEKLTILVGLPWRSWQKEILARLGVLRLILEIPTWRHLPSTRKPAAITR